VISAASCSGPNRRRVSGPSFLPFCVLLLFALHPATVSGQIAVQAEAGFGGYYRVGRWMPIRVEVENQGHDIEGEFVVSWGGTLYRQAIDLPSPSRKLLEFYVLASGSRSDLTLDLILGGHPKAAIDGHLKTGQRK
jgi:hypothetical protein